MKRSVVLALLAVAACGGEEEARPWWPLEEGDFWVLTGISRLYSTLELRIEVKQCAFLGDPCDVAFTEVSDDGAGPATYSLSSSKSSLLGENSRIRAFPTTAIVDGAEVTWPVWDQTATGTWRVNGDCAELLGDDLELGTCRGAGLCYWKCKDLCQGSAGELYPPLGSSLQIDSERADCSPLL